MKIIDFRDLLIFLRNPSLGDQIDIKYFSFFLRLVWKSFLIILVKDIIIGLLIITPLRYFDLFPSLLEFKFTTINILKISLLLPLIEELIFRLPLRFSKINFLASFSIIIFLLLYNLLISSIYLSVSISLGIFLIMYLSLREGSGFHNKLNSFFTKYFREIFYSQALIFGLLHLTNFRIDLKYFFLFPLFVISYITSGCFWGYIRVRYNFGIYACITSHIVLNIIYCYILSR